MSRKKNEEYNWLDDPFNDGKSDPADKRGGTALAGVGCVLVVVLIVILMVVAALTLVGLSADF